MAALKPTVLKPTVKFTYQDYCNAPEDKRYELLDGELVVSPSPTEPHQHVLGNLYLKLALFARERRLGRVYLSPFDVVLTDTDVVQPDLLFVSPQRAHIITVDNVRGAPDLVIEILSPSTATRDRTFKHSLYARHGVREYWLVDTEARTIEVMAIGEHGFESAALYREGQRLTSQVLAGFRLDPSDIF